MKSDWTVGQIEKRTLSAEKMRILFRRLDPKASAISIVSQVLDAVNRSCTPQELSVLIQKSPELSMKVLRLSNSAAFGSRNALTVREAVDFLGWQKTVTLVLTVGLSDYSNSLLASTGWDAEAFQKRSVALALVSQFLSSRCDPWNEERHYLCGLFQEWGYLMLVQHASTQFQPAASVLNKTDVESPIEVEKFYIGTDHAEVGAVAAEEYGLAEDIVAGIRFHHEPALADAHQTMADVAHVSSWIVGEMGIQAIVGASNHILDQYALRRLGWSTEDLEQFRSALHDAATNVSNILRTGQMAVVR